MSERRPAPRPGDDPAHAQERRLQEEREKATAGEHDDAAGPGYTARPTDEEPEEGGARPAD